MLRFSPFFFAYPPNDSEIANETEIGPRRTRCNCNLQLVPVDFWSRERDAADPLNPPKQPVGDGWHTHTERKPVKSGANCTQRYRNIEISKWKTLTMLVHKSLLILRDINPSVA